MRRAINSSTSLVGLSMPFSLPQPRNPIIHTLSEYTEWENGGFLLLHGVQPGGSCFCNSRRILLGDSSRRRTNFRVTFPFQRDHCFARLHHRSIAAGVKNVTRPLTVGNMCQVDTC